MKRTFFTYQPKRRQQRLGVRGVETVTAQGAHATHLALDVDLIFLFVQVAELVQQQVYELCAEVR
jgi:uncharacterized protein with von Willebrand factor type A (vWA) domain